LGKKPVFFEKKNSLTWEENTERKSGVEGNYIIGRKRGVRWGINGENKEARRQCDNAKLLVAGRVVAGGGKFNKVHCGLGVLMRGQGVRRGTRGGLRQIPLSREEIKQDCRVGGEVERRVMARGSFHVKVGRFGEERKAS